MNELRELLLQSVCDNSVQRSEARERLTPQLSSRTDDLYRMLETGDSTLRQAVVLASSLLPQSVFRNELLSAALKDSAPSVLSEACWIIGDMDTDCGDFWTPICGLLSHSKWYVRQAAINATRTCAVEMSEKLNALSEGVHDPAGQVRAELAETLGSLGVWNKITGELIGPLLCDAEAQVRKAAVKSVRRLQPTLSIVQDALERLLADTCWDVRTNTCATVASYGTDASFAIPALKTNAKISDTELQGAAILALSRICTDRR